MPFDFSDAIEKDLRLTHALADMSEAMSEAERLIAESIQRRFEDESDGETPWAPLAERTRADRERHGYDPDHPILERTKTLVGGMKGSHDRDSAEVGPSEDIAYARRLEMGDKSASLPARPYLRLTESEKVDMDNILDNYLSRNGG